MVIFLIGYISFVFILPIIDPIYKLITHQAYLTNSGYIVYYSLEGILIHERIVPFIVWSTLKTCLVLFTIISYIYGPNLLFRKFSPNITPASQVFPKIQNIVESLSKKIGIKTIPKVYTLDTEEPNSLTFGKGKNFRIVITKGMIEVLNDDELENVILHELAHIQNGDVGTLTFLEVFLNLNKYVLFAFISIVILLSVIKLEYLGTFLVTMFSGFFLIYIVPFALYNSISRNRELVADDITRAYSNTPESLASALLKAHRRLILTLMTKKMIAPRGLAIVVKEKTFRIFSRTLAPFFNDHPSLRIRVNRIKEPKIIAQFSYFPSLHDSFVFGSATLFLCMGIPIPARFFILIPYLWGFEYSIPAFVFFCPTH